MLLMSSPCGPTSIARPYLTTPIHLPIYSHSPSGLQPSAARQTSGRRAPGKQTRSLRLCQQAPPHQDSPEMHRNQLVWNQQRALSGGQGSRQQAQQVSLSQQGLLTLCLFPPSEPSIFTLPAPHLTHILLVVSVASNT